MKSFSKTFKLHFFYLEKCRGWKTWCKDLEKRISTSDNFEFKIANFHFWVGIEGFLSLFIRCINQIVSWCIAIEKLVCLFLRCINRKVTHWFHEVLPKNEKQKGFLTTEHVRERGDQSPLVLQVSLGIICVFCVLAHVLSSKNPFAFRF